jgi:hypothetical protein
MPLENLTPLQRVAVIAICLALTLLVAMLLVPWVWNQFIQQEPATATPALGVAFLPTFPAASAFPLISSLEMPLAYWAGASVWAVA